MTDERIRESGFIISQASIIRTLSDDEIVEMFKKVRDAAIEHERQRAVEICDLTLPSMVDRDACARAIRNPESKYPSMPRSRVAAQGELR